MEADDIFKLHEGQCPECDGDVDIISIEGTPPFLSGWPASIPSTEWTLEIPYRSFDFYVFNEEFTYAMKEYNEKKNAVGGIGAMTFRCKSCNEEFYTEKNPFGDWA